MMHLPWFELPNTYLATVNIFYIYVHQAGFLVLPRWMLGLQSLDLSNTRIKGRIPLELGNLPFLMAVDLRNTLMTCCDNYSDAYHAQQQYSPGNASGHDSAHRLLPPFLQFNDANKRSPIDQRMPSDPFLRKMMATGQDLM